MTDARSRTRLGGPLLVAALFIGCRASQPPLRSYDYSNGEEVIRAMHDRYFGRWHQRLVAVQHNLSSPRAGDTARTIWLTAVEPPGRMRIDFEPRAQANGVLILRDTQYVIVGGRPSQVTRAIQPLLLLQHDVYFLDVPVTIARLRELGVDVARSRADVWQGRPVLVVGAAPGDLRSRQVWIDREHMLLVRWIEPSLREPALAVDTRLLEYERMGSAWVPRRIEYIEGDQRVFEQELRQIRANLTLDSLLFRPDDWTRAQHWYQTPVLR
ncbi:MAG: hypothetical protein WEE89_05320 [Gemmatimonadota bacterium]